MALNIGQMSRYQVRINDVDIYVGTVGRLMDFCQKGEVDSVDEKISYSVGFSGEDEIFRLG